MEDLRFNPLDLDILIPGLRHATGKHPVKERWTRSKSMSRRNARSRIWVKSVSRFRSRNKSGARVGVEVGAREGVIYV